MNVDELNKVVTSYIDQSVDGLEIEHPKCDFKSQWYDLSSKPGINEFLKDTSAMANTFGLDGLIVIGYDAKLKTYNDTTFQDSKLSDTSKMTDLVNKKIDRLFDIAIYDTNINGHSLSIIHIPASIDKPHVITNYQSFDKEGNLKKEEQNRIFVRKGTATYPATKYDIELMFYDRKNIIPEYKVNSSFHYKSLTFGAVPSSSILTATISLIMENLGRRPVSIIDIEIQLYIFPEAHGNDLIILKTDGRHLIRPLILNPGNIINNEINFTTMQFMNQNLSYLHEKMHEILRNAQNLLTRSVLLTLSNGIKLSSDLTIATT